MNHPKLMDTESRSAARIVEHEASSSRRNPASASAAGVTLNTDKDLCASLMCDCKTTSPSYLIHHVGAHISVIQNKLNKMYQKIDWCDLKGHIYTHPRENPYECNMCDFEPKEAVSLKRYRLKYSVLKTHQKRHTGEKPYKCIICDYRSARSNDLKRHTFTHTGGKPYECDLCDYKTGQSRHLKQHKAVHTGEKPYECDMCL